MLSDVQEALCKRYPDVHPLIFKRSLEKVKTDGELFDLLETLPQTYPIIWCEKKRAWEHTQELLQSKGFLI